MEDEFEFIKRVINVSSGGSIDISTFNKPRGAFNQYFPRSTDLELTLHRSPALMSKPEYLVPPSVRRDFYPIKGKQIKLQTPSFCDLKGVCLLDGILNDFDEWSR